MVAEEIESPASGFGNLRSFRLSYATKWVPAQRAAGHFEGQNGKLGRHIEIRRFLP